MADYGIKISKPGYDVKTAADKDLVFSSKFFTPRVHLQGHGSITHTGGRTATIAHNLGYVPMFMVHGDISGIPTLFPSGAYGTLPFSVNYPLYQPYKPNQNILTWADTTNIYIKVQDDFGYQYFDANDLYEESAVNFRNYFGIANDDPTFGDMKGAIRFGGVTIAQNTTILEASATFYVGDRVGSSNMYCALYGIDEDNTGDFGSNPMGRSKTSARHRPEFNPSDPSQVSVGCKEAVQEIISRSGWSSGNNLGLLFIPEGVDSPPSGNSILGYIGNGYWHLKVLTNNTLLNYKYTIYKDKII